jgi:hypothetical protein
MTHIEQFVDELSTKLTNDYNENINQLKIFRKHLSNVYNVDQSKTFDFTCRAAKIFNVVDYNKEVISDLLNTPLIKRKQRLRFRVFEAKGEKCYICNKRSAKFLISWQDVDDNIILSFVTEDGIEMTLDHVVPVSKGGSRKNISNIMPCCRICNQKKSNN